MTTPTSRVTVIGDASGPGVVTGPGSTVQPSGVFPDLERQIAEVEESKAPGSPYFYRDGSETVVDSPDGATSVSAGGGDLDLVCSGDLSLSCASGTQVLLTQAGTIDAAVPAAGSFSQTVGAVGIGFNNLGPGNVPQWSVPTTAVALRIRGPGWLNSINPTIEMLTSQSSFHANFGALDLVSYENTIGITFIQNMLLYRDAPTGSTYWRQIKGRSQSVGAVSTDIRTYAPPDGNVFKAYASVLVSNDTDNEGGTFATIVGTFQRVGGTLTQRGATQVLGTDELPASIGAATVAFAVSSPNLIVRGTGVAAKTITWSCSRLDIEQCPIT